MSLNIFPSDVVKVMLKTKEDFKGKRDSELNKKPLVYILKGDDTLYIGETSDIYERMKSHISKKKFFDEIYIIDGYGFNDSITYHLETLLIDYLFGEEFFKVVNLGTDQKIKAYSGHEDTKWIFDKLWKELIRLGLAFSPQKDIESKFIFKYSPFKFLSVEQNHISEEVVSKMFSSSQEGKAVIEGEPGTGKSIVLITIAYKLVKDKNVTPSDIAIVIPQSHLLGSFKKQVRKIGLHGVKVLSPGSFINEKNKYRYVIVDETHRLKRYFGKQAGMLGHLKDESGEWKNELELILKLSYNCVIFYDRFQTVRPADISEEIVSDNTTGFDHYCLKKQFRLKSGEEYLKWLRNLLQMDESNSKYTEEVLNNYDFHIVSSIKELQEFIQNKNKEHTLARMVSGYAWPWKSKTQKDLFDIVEGDTKLRWNRVIANWVHTKTSSEEVGCIHTIQGSDLNYVGVIIGKEIVYDETDKKIKVIRAHYYDKNGKTILKEDPTDQQLLKYVKYVYYVLLSRGIEGCCLYIADPKLKQYIETIVTQSRK